MFQDRKSESVNIRNNLLKEIATIEERIKTSESNKAYYEEVTTKVAEFQKRLDSVRNLTNHLTNVFKNIAYYVQEKKENQLNVLENAIKSVSEIVPSSEYTTCKLSHKDGKTRILNEFDQPIIKREGDGSISSMGILLAYCTLKAQPNKIQLLFLDEVASTLSSESLMNLRDVIKAISADVGVVGIEQHNMLYSGLADKIYKLEKVGNYSVLKEEVNE